VGAELKARRGTPCLPAGGSPAPGPPLSVHGAACGAPTTTFVAGHRILERNLTRLERNVTRREGNSPPP